MEIKVGDKVHLTENYKMAFGFSGEGVVIAIMDECGLVALRKCHTITWIPFCDLIKVEEEKKGNTITIPVEADLTDSFLTAYTADLAKEIVLKVADICEPEVAAEYAVSVAKAVAEGLKKK